MDGYTDKTHMKMEHKFVCFFYKVEGEGCVHCTDGVT